MTSGITYRHRRMLDADMHVRHVAYVGASYIKAKVIWMLRRNGMVLGEDNVRIPRAGLADWKRVR